MYGYRGHCLIDAQNWEFIQTTCDSNCGADRGASHHHSIRSTFVRTVDQLYRPPCNGLCQVSRGDGISNQTLVHEMSHLYAGEFFPCKLRKPGNQYMTCMQERQRARHFLSTTLANLLRGKETLTHAHTVVPQYGTNDAYSWDLTVTWLHFMVVYMAALRNK